MSDSLDPIMPTGEDQPFQNWLDFLERVARPIVEGDRATEDAAMGLYRQANPHFICAALVIAAAERDQAIAEARAGVSPIVKANRERDRLRAVVDAAHELLDADRTSWSDEHARLADALDALDMSGEATGE